MNWAEFTNKFSDEQFFNFFGTKKSETFINHVNKIEITQTHICKIVVSKYKNIISAYFKDNLDKEHRFVNISDIFMGFFLYNSKYSESYTIILHFADKLMKLPLKNCVTSEVKVEYTLFNLKYNDSLGETLNIIDKSPIIFDQDFFQEFDLQSKSIVNSESLNNSTLFLGHRGSGPSDKSINYIENTEHAFDTAILNGALWIELDVQLTFDLVPIIYHNHFINFQNRKISINSLNFNELTEIHSKEYPNINHKIITLQDLLSKYNNTNFNVEIKYPMLIETKEFNYVYTDPLVYTKRIIEVVDKFRKNSNIIFSCFNPQVLMALKVIQVKDPIFFLLHEIDTDNEVVQCSSILYAFIFCKQINANGIVLYDRFLNDGCKNLINFFHKYNLKVFAYGKQLNELDKVTEFVLNGLDGVITDKIELVNEKSVIYN